MQKERVQAHRLTASALEDLQRDQISGTEATVKATDGKTDIKKADRHLYHVRLEIPNFNSASGERLSRPFVQVMSDREFTQAKDSGAFNGYTVEILHNPGDMTDAEALETGAPSVTDISYATALELQYKELYGEAPDPLLPPVEVRKKIDEEIVRQAVENARIETETRLRAEYQAQDAQAKAIAEGGEAGKNDQKKK